MALSRKRRPVSYGLSDALVDIPSAPIIAERAPTSSDSAPLGTVWIDRPNDDAYFITSVSSNSATWINAGGGSGLFTSLTVNPGDITVTAGDIDVLAGDITVSAGDIDVTLGDVTLAAGDFVATLGNVSAGATVSAGTTITAGTGITATTGNIVASAGNVSAVALESSAGITAGTGVSITTGDLTVVVGDINVSALGVITGGSIAASADVAGVVGTNSITNVVDSTQGAGTLTIRSTTANSGDNTGGGFLKIYVENTAMYIPYFTAAGIAP